MNDENDRRRGSDQEVELLKYRLAAMEVQLKEREDQNRTRMEKLEKAIEALNLEKAKWGGAVILLAAIGSLLMWVASVGGSLSKIVGK